MFDTKIQVNSTCIVQNVKVQVGNSMSKVQEKSSTSKTKFLIMKYERTKGYEMVFTVSNPNFSFGANLGQQLK